MKHAANFGNQWAKLAIILVLCLSTSSDEHHTDGFLIDMMPLLGSHGKITAVAPGCRAVTGYIEQFPFIWSRDFGIIYLNAGAEYFGIGNFLSDDGQVMVGTLAADEREQTGFIWNYGGEVHFMYELNILRTTWGGLSADGKVATGYSHPSETAWIVRDGTRLQKLGHSLDTSVALSRDGKKVLIRYPNRSVCVVDPENGESRELKFGGVSAVRGNNYLRADDLKNPLRHWGLVGEVSDSTLHHENPDSPMHLDWLVDSPFLFRHLNFDGKFALGTVTLNNYRHIKSGKELFRTRRLESYMGDPSEILTVLARLDDEGNAVVIDDNRYGGALSPLALSDNGKIALYKTGNKVKVWNEDLYRGQHHVPLYLKEYLAEFGFHVPSDREIETAVMSPDGKCFFAGFPRKLDEESFPYQYFLACIGDDIEPPHWILPEGGLGKP